MACSRTVHQTAATSRRRLKRTATFRFHAGSWRRGPAARAGLPLALLMILTALCLSNSTRAQVNVEPVRNRLNGTGRTLDVKANLTGKTGNTEQLAFGAAALLGLRDERNLFYISSTADYSRLNHETNVASAFAHARYNRKFLEWLWGELFAQMESDRFRRVALRTLLGAGPRFILTETPELAVYYGASYMLEVTERTTAVTADRREQIAHRFNNYATLNVHPHPRIGLSETVYYQPRFDRWSDYWLLSVFSARFEVTQTLSTQIDFTAHRESSVPPGVKRTDTTVVSSLAFTW